MPWRFLIAFLAAAGLSMAAAEPQPLTNAVTLPISLTHHRARLEVRINEQGPFTILLDTACTIPTLHPTVVEELKLSPSGSIRIVGIAGEESAPTFRNLHYQLGSATYSPRRVASLPSEREHSRRRRDGVVGSSFFRRFVTEIDIEAKKVRLHDPATYEYSGNGEIVPLKFREEIPVISATIVIPGQPEIAGEFEVDTGCDSGLCIGEKFVNEHKLIEAIESRTGEKFGIGGSVDTRMGYLPIVRIGKMEIKQAQADLFLEGSPVDEPMIGHIGMGLLHRYRLILDYSRQRLILESR